VAVSSSINQLEMKATKQVPSVSIQESQAQDSIQCSSDRAEARAEPVTAKIERAVVNFILADRFGKSEDSEDRLVNV